MEQIVYRQQLEGVIMVEQVTREENYSMPYRHFHDTFELYYLTEGESYYFIDRETRASTPSSAPCLPPAG